MSDESCACLTVKYVTQHEEHGAVSGRWLCVLCNSQFVPMAALKAERAKVARLRAALQALVEDTDNLTHNPKVCSRHEECDEAADAGEECGADLGECPECECGAKTTRELAAAARLVLRETGGES